MVLMCCALVSIQVPLLFYVPSLITMTQQMMGNINIEPHGLCHTACCHLNRPGKLALIYFPFLRGHYSVKIYGSILPVFDMYQGLVSTYNFLPLLMQQFQHAQ